MASSLSRVVTSGGTATMRQSRRTAPLGRDAAHRSLLPPAHRRLDDDDAIAVDCCGSGHRPDLRQGAVRVHLELVDDPLGARLGVEVPAVGCCRSCDGPRIGRRVTQEGELAGG